MLKMGIIHSIDRARACTAKREEAPIMADKHDKGTEGFPEQLAGGLKKIFLAGLGAAATVVEK